MPTEQDVTSLVGIGRPVKVTMNDNNEWSIVIGETVFRTGTGEMNLLNALAEAQKLEPTASVATGGRRKSRRRSSSRKTRRSRK